MESCPPNIRENFFLKTRNVKNFFLHTIYRKFEAIKTQTEEKGDREIM